MGMFDFVGDIGSAIGGAIGIGDTQGDRDAENANLKAWQDYVGKLDPNSIKDMGSSAFKGISTDPRTRQYQMQALSKMSGVANEGGLDPESRAAMADARASTFSDEKAQRGALENSLSARGLMGSGAELSGLLQAGQGGANADAMAGLHAAADARQRAMQAQQNLLSGASGVRGQDWGEAAQRAGAEDQAARFNAEQTNARFNAGLGKAGAMGDNTKAYNQYYNNDQAIRMAEDQGLGQAIGGGVGSIANFAAAGPTGGMSMMASGGGAGAASYNNAIAKQYALKKMGDGGGQPYYQDYGQGSYNPTTNQFE